MASGLSPENRVWDVGIKRITKSALKLETVPLHIAFDVDMRYYCPCLSLSPLA